MSSFQLSLHYPGSITNLNEITSHVIYKKKGKVQGTKKIILTNWQTNFSDMLGI